MELQDARLIRLVTSRYRDLQGLYTIFDASFPLCFGLALLLLTVSERAAIVAGVLGIIGVAAILPLRSRLRTYYVVRFGRTHTVMPFLAAAAISWMYQGLLWAAILTNYHAPGFVRMIVVLVLVGAYPAWIVARDWPFRSHWIPVAGTGILAAARVADAPTYHTALERLAVCWFLLGVTLAIAGWCDHRLLTRVLSGAKPETQEA